MSIGLPKPFQNILRLASGDILGKILSFLALIYLARVLKVPYFGILEFAGSVLVYLLVFADGGIELWATREASKTTDIPALAARVLPVRVLLATVIFVILLPLLPLFPKYPDMRLVIVLYAFGIFVQAVNLKWTFMGQQNMALVARGLVIGQVLFAAAVFAFIHDSVGMVWVPVLRLFGDLATALYFGWCFRRAHGYTPLQLTLHEAGTGFRAAFTIGLSEAIGLLTFNFDTLLLGFLRGVLFVGWYNAAYHIILIPVSLTMTYFVGLFPALSRSFAQDLEEFRRLVRQTIKFWLTLAVPLVIGGTFLAAPMIQLLYGTAYASSARPLQILVWAAGLVALRYIYMDSLRASGHQALDLRCAISASALNVGLCVALIPRFGMIGAAAATVSSEALWLGMAFYYFERSVLPHERLPSLRGPAIGGAAMVAVMWFSGPLSWIIRGILGLATYAVVQAVLGELKLKHFFRTGASA